MKRKYYEIITNANGRSTFLTRAKNVKGALKRLIKLSNDFDLVVDEDYYKMVTIKIKELK